MVGLCPYTWCTVNERPGWGVWETVLQSVNAQQRHQTGGVLLWRHCRGMRGLTITQCHLFLYRSVHMKDLFISLKICKPWFKHQVTDGWSAACKTCFTVTYISVCSLTQINLHVNCSGSISSPPPAESLLAVIWTSLVRFVNSTVESGEYVDVKSSWMTASRNCLHVI